MSPDAPWWESAEKSWLATRIAVARVAGLPDATYVDQALAGELFPDRIRRSVPYPDRDALETRVRQILEGMRIEDRRPWPTPLACALRELLEESQGSWMRLAGRVKDALEVFVKYATAIALCDVLERSVPEPLRDALAQSITRPSLGHWVSYGRSAAEALPPEEYFVRELPGFFRGWMRTDGDRISALRNASAHAGTRPEEEYAIDFEHGLALLFGMMRAGLGIWKGFRLVAFDETGAVLGEGCRPIPFEGLAGFPEGAVVLLQPDRVEPVLDLSPLLAYRLCRAPSRSAHACGLRQFLFFNDRKSEKAVTYLDYPVGHLGRDRDMLEIFERRFEVWLSRARETFEATILDRTGDFVGREAEIALVRDWVRNRDRGTIVIKGAPGSGKSALMSAFCRIGSQTLADDFDGLDYATLLDPEEWGRPAVVRYFAKRGEITDTPKHFLKTILSGIGEAFSMPVNLSGDEGDLFRELEHQLGLVSKRLAEGHPRFGRLLLLVDGLDESAPVRIGGGGAGIAACIPRRLPSRVHVLVASRACEALDALVGGLVGMAEPMETHELKGLEPAQVGEFLRRTVSHYDVGDDYVRAVHRVSEGNPHYLKLLAEELVEGRQTLDAAEVPSHVEAIYTDIRRRLEKEGGSPVVDLLTTLALSHEMLTQESIAGFLGTDLSATERALSVASEVLFRVRGKDRRTYHRLFHEKFREFVRNDADYRAHTAATTRRILRHLCAGDGEGRIGDDDRETLDRFLDEDPPCAEEAPTLMRVFENASRSVTGFRLLRERLEAFPPATLGDLIPQLGVHAGPGGARLLSDAVTELAHREPATAARILDRLLAATPDRGMEGRATSCRIALDAAVESVGLQGMSDAVCGSCFSVCTSPDASLRALGVHTLFRLRKRDHDDGMRVLRELSRTTTVAGIPKPAAVVAFAAAAAGMFFESSSDPRLRRDLSELVGQALDRIPMKGLLLLVVPRVMANLLSVGVNDFNPINLAEIKHHKRYMRGNRAAAESVERMLRYADPRRGTDEEFDRAVESFYTDLGGVRDGLAMYALQAAVIARTLNGREAALESSWRCSTKKEPGDHAAPQDFLFQLRITQLGRAIRNQSPLHPRWTERAEEVSRRFFYGFGAVYRVGYPYVGGGLIPGTVFLAHQTGSPEVASLREFVDWAYGDGRTRAADPERPRKYHPDAVLLRTIEVIGLEYGSYDALARDAARFGLACFLDHADRFDPWTWDRVATILARMRTYAPGEVERFVGERDPLVRQELETRLQGARPKEGLDTLLSMRTEFLYAQVLGEAPDEPGGFRPEWCRFLGTLLGPQRPARTYRDLARRLLAALGR